MLAICHSASGTQSKADSVWLDRIEYWTQSSYVTTRHVGQAVYRGTLVALEERLPTIHRRLVYPLCEKRYPSLRDGRLVRRGLFHGSGNLASGETSGCFADSAL
jgi:hypothetical protein